MLGLQVINFCEIERLPLALWGYRVNFGPVGVKVPFCLLADRRLNVFSCRDLERLFIDYVEFSVFSLPLVKNYENSLVRLCNQVEFSFLNIEDLLQINDDLVEPEGRLGDGLKWGYIRLCYLIYNQAFTRDGVCNQIDVVQKLKWSHRVVLLFFKANTVYNPSPIDAHLRYRLKWVQNLLRIVLFKI